ncbi:MAG: thiamine pyrophosphate-requiring protein [Alphaproteobacteria bacterium]|nr:thiamine pyrophosphate-requiring protein [Alphaproteobacteria bacterium]
MTSPVPARTQSPAKTVAEAYLALLAERGVEYLFANAGTDFAPLIEAFAKAHATGAPAPKAITAVHENVAVSMAHGYAMVSGRIPAVMVHVSVGTANGVCAIMNAARENVAMLFTAGRSPLTEEGMTGARDFTIHWAQEMFDQAGLVREFVKWDYELRNAVQLETVVDRALAIARSEPAGPVYLSLPREVLAAPIDNFSYDKPSRRVASAPAGPDTAAIAEAATILAGAENPLIITSNAGRDPQAVAALGRFADRHGIPVIQYRPRHVALPAGHAMHLGYDPRPFIGEADAVLVLESDVPWLPNTTTLRHDCRVVQIGLDPLFARYPIRGFRTDLALTSASRPALEALGAALVGRIDEQRLSDRRQAIQRQRATLQQGWAERVEAVRRATPIHPAWVSHCLGQAKGEDALVINEYPLMTEHCSFTAAGTFFNASAVSGLGWGMGAALGAKLAAPERLVVATLGDGSYMFNNPVAAHYAARQNDLPILTIVFNNAMWHAVRRATVGLYPNGYAAKSNEPVLTHLADLPAFEQVCMAAGGHGERVVDPAELPAALWRAIHAVMHERRQALLNVICQAA